MDLDDIKRGLRAEIEKRENEQYATFQCNIRQMCKDVLDKLEEQESLIKEMKEERRWRKCSEELPTAKDANESGKLLGYLGGFKIAHEYHWTDVRDKLHGITHWMPLPKAPEEAKV